MLEHRKNKSKGNSTYNIENPRRATKAAYNMLDSSRS